MAGTLASICGNEDESTIIAMYAVHDDGIRIDIGVDDAYYTVNRDALLELVMSLGYTLHELAEANRQYKYGDNK